MKKVCHILLVLGSMLPFTGTQAQQNWLQGAGGNANDEALDIVHDAAGNIYTAGYFSQAARFDNILTASVGMGDLFISKQSSNGTFMWVATAGGVLEDKAKAITVTASGEIYITGTFCGTAQFGPFNLTSSGGSQDIFAAKLDNSGNFLWAQRYGGSDTDIATDIDQDDNGSLIITGQFKGISSFGSYTFTSANYPPSMPGTGGLPSYDALLFKTNFNGNVLWAKQGAAVYDDRILKVVTDELSNIYVCGQFSDTISFTNTYANNSFNAGFVMKFDSTGHESWFRRIMSTQVMIYDMTLELGNLFLTGDFDGTLVYRGTPNHYISNTSDHKIFIIKAAASNGDYLDGTSEGSENIVSSRGIGVDPSGSVFITGYFKCSFTTFSAIHGNAIFNSAGFRDVFVIKYNTTLNRQWEKHYGGIGDDYPTALSVKMNDQPVFAGSYSKNFNVTDGGHFYPHINNTISHNSNYGNVVCGNSHYGKFVTLDDWGNKDILLARPVDPVCPLLDYFQRPSGTCSLDTLMPVRYPLGDTIIACDSVELYIVTPTTVDSIQAPDWIYSWSNGDSHFSTMYNTSGWKYISYGYADDCRSFVDSFYVQLYVSPPQPTVTAYNAFMMSAIPIGACINKAVVDNPGDTALFVASGIPSGYSMHWVLPDGSTNTSDSILAYIPGTYSLVSESPGGLCIAANCITLAATTSGSCTSIGVFTPQIIFTDSTFQVTDTVSVCEKDHFEMQLVDSTFFLTGIPTTINTFATWHISGGFAFDPFLSYPNTFGSHIQSFKALVSGPCNVSIDILNPFDGSIFATVSRNFYLDVHQPPSNLPVISGSAFFCPGDTVTLTVSGGGSYNWTGPGIIFTNAPAYDTALVGMMGEYTVVSTTVDSVLGCTDVTNTFFILSSNPAPLVSMNPSHGVICPFDSVMLTAEPGSGYTWYGPSGTIISTLQTIWVSTPGIYYYTFTNASGCSLVSDMAEVLEYSTPYLDAVPGTSLCASGTLLIGVESNPDAIVTWAAPFSGSSFTQTVTSPGTYSVSVNFCSITTTANIVITPAISTPIDILYTGNDTICSQDTLILLATGGFDEYIWHPAEQEGQVFVGLGAGTFTVEATDSQGCISGDTISIYSYPEVDAPETQDTTICAGATFFITATAPLGTTLFWYTDLFGGNLLANNDSLFVNIGQNDTSFFVSAYNGTCFSERTILTVHISPGSQVPVITGTLHLCIGDTLHLEPDSIMAGVQYTWNGPGITSLDTTELIIYSADTTQAGIYTLYSTTPVCTSSIDSAYVNVSNIHLQNFSSSSYSTCQHDTLYLFTDTLSGSYLWNNASTDTVIHADLSGDYYYIYTDIFGCIANSDTTTVVILTAPSTPTVNDTSVCIGSPVTLYASSSGNTINWYNTQDSLIGTGSSYTFSAITSYTEVYVQVVDTNGCFSLADSAHIFIIPQAVSPLLSVTDTLCVTDTLFLSSSSMPGWAYHWNGPAGFSSSMEDPFITPLNPSNSGLYSLYVTNGYCLSDTADVYIHVDSIPYIIVTNNPTLCYGDSIVLFATGNASVTTWSTGATGQFIEVSPTATTLYWVSSYNVCGSTMQNIYVIVNPLPVVSNAGDVILVAGETIQLEPGGGITYSWHPSSGLSCTDCFNPYLTLTEDQTYYLTVTDSNGCSNVTDLFVDVQEVYTLYIPNAFTPDNDGLNDEFKVKGNNIAEFSMQIYTRLGDMIFETDNKDLGWNGKYKEKDVQPVVYVYNIYARFENGEERKYKGSVTLVK